jgi:aldehyde:ferredoxin oxidoreductase
MMKETIVKVERFAPRYGWANRILHVDLSDQRVWVEPLDGYAPDYIGGRGIAAKIAWDMCPEPVDPLASENPLIIVTGALTGTRSPYSGRTEICSFSPHAYPYNWFTRANIGHQWGAELKHAGYDGLVITGASDVPVQIIVRDDEVRLTSANHLWGQDAYDVQDSIRQESGKEIKSLVIGPAGENLSRIATIHTATSSTAGQSGFGAVMGAKKLKAISVLGSGQVALAHSEAFNTFVKDVSEEIRTYKGIRNLDALNEQLKACGGKARPYACTASCPTPCNLYYANVPGLAHPERRWEGHWTCVGGLFRGIAEGGPVSFGGLYDWNLGLQGGLEMNVLSNRYGLNQWELTIGIVPWLERCQRAGLISEMNGMPMNWQDPHFWDMFLHAIAYREGLGDILAEGGVRAARTLGLGEDLMGRHYTAWGYAGHWDGHGCWTNHLVFPFWLVSALQWSTDTRDPYSSSHCYVQNVMRWGPFSMMRRNLPPEQAITWDHMRGIAAHLYGSPDASDPLSGYKAKAYPAFYHDRRSVIKDSVSTDDQTFTLIYHPHKPDRYFRVGDIEGPAVDYHLFRLGTGTEWSEADFDRAADRIYTLERALCVRHWGRDRQMDETALPSFEYAENWVNPLIEQPQALDRQQFRPVQDEYYRLLGWDPQTGWPTPERLQELGIGEIHAPMVAGGEQAQATRPAWPQAVPITP